MLGNKVSLGHIALARVLVKQVMLKVPWRNLVDAPDLGSGSCESVGSNPSGTTQHVLSGHGLVNVVTRPRGPDCPEAPPRWSNGHDVGLRNRRSGFNSWTGHVLVAKWQTRPPQKRVPEEECGFDSHRGHGAG